jgi:hypothetical protein
VYNILISHSSENPFNPFSDKQAHPVASSAQCRGTAAHISQPPPHPCGGGFRLTRRPFPPPEQNPGQTGARRLQFIT